MLLIDKWLQGNRNFIIGRNLYQLYGTNNALKNLLDKGETPYHQQLLVNALQEINSSGIKPVEKPIEVALKVAKVMQHDENPVLQSIHQEWTKLYNEMKFYQHQLDVYGSDNSQSTREKCKPICKKVLDLEYEINELWNKRDYYKEHGKLPEVKEVEFVIPTDPLEIARAINTLERNIRRNKAELKKHPDKPQYAALVEQYQHKLNQLKNATKKD